MNQVVYFSKMFQAVPHLAQVAKVLPGIFVTTRRSTDRVVAQHYPALPRTRAPRLLGRFSKGHKTLEAASVIVTGSPYRNVLGSFPAPKCMVFHGTYMMLSREALISNLHQDLLCIIGPRMKSMIERHRDLEVPPMVETGFLPFCEFPERTPAQRAETLTALGLDPDRQTVVYTPSRRGVGSWEYVAESLIATAPGHFNLILRPHPSQGITPRRVDREHFRRAEVQASKRGRTRIDRNGVPLSTVLSVADLLVSDANSPTEESLFYDVPQLMIENPRYSRDHIVEVGRREEMHPEDLEQLLTLFDCGPTLYVCEPLDFSQSLEVALQDASRYAPARAAYFKWVFGDSDQSANVRVAQAIRQQFL